MPQKKNPDVLELIRARASVVKGCAQIVGDVVCKLPSGYSRDMQETKEPAMKGLWLTVESITIAAKLFSRITCDKDALTGGLTGDVFATDLALKYVSEGIPFRSAYDRVKNELSAGMKKSLMDSALAGRRKLTSDADTGLREVKKRNNELKRWQRQKCAKLNKVEKDVLSLK